MKRIFFIAALLSTNQLVYSFSEAKFTYLSIPVDELTFEEKIKKIQDLHRNIYNLPFDREYIVGTIMVDVQKKREEVAPHFPSREQTGSDEELINTAFKNWFENYPSEYTNYIEQANLIIRKYSLMNK